MAEFAVNPHRFDPYKNFKFRVKWEGRYVAGISTITPLRRRTEVISYRTGSEPSITRKAPGRTSFDPITLERGVTHDTECGDVSELHWGKRRFRGTLAELTVTESAFQEELEPIAAAIQLAFRRHRCGEASHLGDGRRGEVAAGTRSRQRRPQRSGL
jgi:hypothetical protein